MVLAQALATLPCEENAMSRIDDALGVSQQALIFRSLRSSVLANNIANSETPNYLAKDFDFKTALDTAAGGHLKMAVSDESHLGTSKQDEFGSTLYRIPTKLSRDGNSVEAEVEQAAFSDNAVRYQTSLQFLNGTFRTLRLAIKGE
jgi:flagellar basal-body rod protein FlgB